MDKFKEYLFVGLPKLVDSKTSEIGEVYEEFKKIIFAAGKGMFEKEIAGKQKNYRSVLDVMTKLSGKEYSLEHGMYTKLFGEGFRIANSHLSVDHEGTEKILRGNKRNRTEN